MMGVGKGQKKPEEQVEEKENDRAQVDLEKFKQVLVDQKNKKGNLLL